MSKNKRRYSRKISFVFGWVFCCTVLQAQNKEVKLHSQTDYAQKVPFWDAYAQEGVQIGVLSDPHLHAIYTEDTASALAPFYNAQTDTYQLVRSLRGQMASTRLFNENYFAFRQALTDLVAQGVKLIIISGDYTDDGQELNLKATQKLLSEFQTNYGIRFFLTNGNHEAVNQIDREGGKPDFVTQEGGVIGVYSSSELKQREEDVVYPPLKEIGYETMFPLIKDFGLQPYETDLFYSTPFHALAYESYTADQDFSLKHRKYENNGIQYPDFTYLVEPVEGVWILAIDGNMYKQVATDTFKNTSDGYHFIEERKYLLQWIEQVVVEAKKRGKRLITFGHYPLLDFNNGQRLALEKLLGKDKFQLSRVPTEETQEQWLQTGLTLHFAGHMHLNQHGFKKLGEHSLWNIQVPSLAAYPPAYKLVEIKNKTIAIQTVELEEVAGYDSLFPLYQKEVGKSEFQDFFKAKNYRELTKSHLKYLSEHRFYTHDFADKKWDKYKQVPNLEVYIAPKMKAKWSKKQRVVVQQLNFKTLLFDLYLIRNGNTIGIAELDADRREVYQAWHAWNLVHGASTPLDQLVDLLVNIMEHSTTTNYLEVDG